MCEPTTLAILAGGLQFGGAVQKGFAARSAAEANANIMEGNAAIAEAQAADALQRGEQGAGRVRTQGGTVVASQRAEYAASGVSTTSGSAADVGTSTAAISELDAQIIKNNAMREAFGFTTEGKTMRRQARYTRQAGDAAFASSVLGGVVQSAAIAGKGMSIGSGPAPSPAAGYTPDVSYGP